MAGGSWSDIFRAGVQGVVTGAIAAAIGGAVLHGWGDKALTAWADKAYGAAVGYHALQSAGHAVVGGGLSELTGGNFKDGFIGAGFAALLSPVGRGINRRLKLGEPGTGNSWQYLGRTATAATMGGTVTAISGGKFGNGAATAAFMHVVNAEATSQIAEKLARVRAAVDDSQHGLLFAIDTGGEHVALAWRYTNEDGYLVEALWDPAGSYKGLVGGNEGSARLFVNYPLETDFDLRPQWSWESYAKYHFDGGDEYLKVTPFILKTSEINAILEKALASGSGWCTCAIQTSSALEGIGPFKGVSSRSPQGFNKAIENIHTSSNQKVDAFTVRK
jgi:hypothetical protein